MGSALGVYVRVYLAHPVRFLVSFHNPKKGAAYLTTSPTFTEPV